MGALKRAISKKTACASRAKTFAIAMACPSISSPTGGTGMGGTG